MHATSEGLSDRENVHVTLNKHHHGSTHYHGFEICHLLTQFMFSKEKKTFWEKLLIINNVFVQSEENQQYLVARFGQEEIQLQPGMLFILAFTTKQGFEEP